MTFASSPERPTSGRKRRVAGWAFLVTGLLSSTGIAVSQWYRYYHFDIRSRSSVIIASGVFTYHTFPTNYSILPSVSNGLELADTRRMDWWIAESDPLDRLHVGVVRIGSPRWGTPSIEIQVVLWPIPLVLLASGVLVLASGRNARKHVLDGRCTSCSYDRAGLASETPCPECGTTVRSNSRRTVLPPRA